MARNNRQQRRARRREQAAGDSPEQPPAPKPPAGPSRRASARQGQVRPAAAAPQETARREPRQRGRFVRESWAELNKVEWPGRGQVIAGTVAVIIACVIVGAYLWVADLALQRIVERVLL